MTIKALLPKKIEQFKEIRNDKVFVLILMLHYMFEALDTADGFVEKIKVLLDEYPEISLVSMGFPDDWNERI